MKDEINIHFPQGYRVWFYQDIELDKALEEGKVIRRITATDEAYEDDKQCKVEALIIDDDIYIINIEYL